MQAHQLRIAQRLLKQACRPSTCWDRHQENQGSYMWTQPYAYGIYRKADSIILALLVLVLVHGWHVAMQISRKFKRRVD
jgi:hypothetical protein